MHTQQSSTPYLYRPIAHFGGEVLKCCGVATETSRAIVQEHASGDGLPGCRDRHLIENGLVIEVDHYAGDRILASTHEEFDTANYHRQATSA